GFPRGEDTAFDLAGDLLLDVEAERRESDRFDAPLLRRIEAFGRAERTGVEEIVLHGDRLSTAMGSPPRIDREIAKKALSLSAATPPEQRVRVAGKLDMIRDSDRVFALIVEESLPVRGLWVGDDMGPLQRL